MKNRSLYFLGFLIMCLAIVNASAVPVPTRASTCTQINAYMSYGQTDSVSGGPVIMLQDFLQSAGYLTVSPNGHFGPSTLSAVEAYQSANGIPATGYVGPLTLASINKTTCSAESSANSSSNTSSNSSANSQTCPIGYVCTPTTQTTADNASVTAPVTSTADEGINTNVTSPATGQVLSIGSSTVIRWNNTPSGAYNISLEQPGGSGAGFIALNQSSNTASPNEYVWSVGKVSTPQSNSAVVSPGTYRIRLQSSVSGASPDDQTSGWFTIVAEQFAVNSVEPSSAYADNTTSIVMFGTGFTNSTAIYFDSNYSSMRANNQYVSPDGTVLVFTIPTNVPSGSHTLYINNSGYNSSPVTMPFTVLSVQ